MTVLAREGQGGASRRGRTPVAIAIATSLSASLLIISGPSTSAQSTLAVTVGAGDGTVAGNAFMPGDVTVAVGDSIAFSIGSDEPHTITFGPGPDDVLPPFWPISGFDVAAPAEGDAPPTDLGKATTDGSAFINTGILFGKGSTATVEFTAPGPYTFFCAIHPGMSGTVTVVEDGATTTQEEADAAIAATSDELLGQVGSLHQARLDSATTVDNGDGTQTWNVFADASTAPVPLTGGGMGYLELLRFTPDAIRIEPGDTISWTADQVHTVTFVPEGTNMEELFPTEEARLGPMGGSTYDGTEPASSGILNISLSLDVPITSEYSLTFPEAGIFPFFCALHAELGQVGVVAVGMDVPDMSG